MPGTYIHMSAMHHAAEGLKRGKYKPPASERINPDWSGLDLTNLGKLMSDHSNFANLGATGPDLFFFLPDFRDEDGIPVSSVLVTVLNFMEKVYNTLDPYVSKWEHYLGPISEDTAEEMSRLTGGLSETVGDIVGELSGILTTLLEDFFIDQKDWWEFFSLGLNKGYDDQAYFWSDMLHYRETGRFARSILEHGQGDDGVKAYVAGYITHLATDVTGHAFVNTISGGPFRLHWQRHHLVENHMDAFWYLNDILAPKNGDRYPQLTESALYYDFAFEDGTNNPVARPAYPTGDTLRETWERRRMLDIDSLMPDNVANALVAAMVDIFYQGGPHPKILRDNDGRPSSDLIKQSYDLYFRFLKYMTLDGLNHEPPAPPDVFPNLDFPTPSDPNSDPPGSGSGGGDGNFWDDLLDFLLSIINDIAYVLEVAVYLATLPWAILADLITYPLRLGAYYALELPLFHLLKLFRAVLVMTGYAYPQMDEINMGLIHIGASDESGFNHLLDDINDTFGRIPLGPEEGTVRLTFHDKGFPYAHPDDEFHHPWAYPDYTESELPLTFSGPYGGGVGPEVLFGDVPSDPLIRDRLEQALTPADADGVGPDLRPNRHLGDSLSFSKYLIWLETRDPLQKDGTQVPLTEWNLDADRGYGYHDWDWNRDPNQAPVNDPEGNPFQPPCTWPQQSGKWNPGMPLLLHWTGPGLEDPGCNTNVIIAAPGRPIRTARRLPKVRRQK
ncbi:MAG TPA: zinc dependent phospholipase C family protein [Anaerolineaceae bacterium]|nr:zinc dependent phospholipase C family protein [Anaerolineaceae bacterium]